jgi:predicted nuclease with TOPRIM domain
MNPSISTQYSTPDDAPTASPLGSTGLVNDRVKDLSPDIQRVYAQLELLQRNYNRLANRVRELETRLELTNQRMN